MLNDKVKQEIYQIVLDKSLGMILPEMTNEFEDWISREIDRSSQYIENRLQTSLTPARLTNLPKSVKEAYENRGKYKDSINQNFYTYPRWVDLEPVQKGLYGNNPANYKDGTLPFNLLTNDQLALFSSNVVHSPIKVGDAERLDGKATAYFTTYRAPIITVYSVALAFTAPPGYEGRNLFFRLYKPNEFYVYSREGAIHIFPAVMARILATTSMNDPLFGSQYGPVVPRIPQVILIDYEYGYTDANRPYDLLEAVAIRTVMQLILMLSSYLTAGLKSFGIEGFNASFGNNGLLYENIYNEYKAKLKELLHPYYRISMTAW